MQQVNTLIGSNNPSGRLPYTLYPANMTAVRKINEYDLRAHEGLTYQWYSGSVSGPALWEFGAGGSYTNFSFTWQTPPQRVVSTVADAETELSYSVTVRGPASSVYFSSGVMRWKSESERVSIIVCAGEKHGAAKRSDGCAGVCQGRWAGERFPETHRLRQSVAACG